MNKLYVTSMNPNGTSDLIITDENHMVIDSISEAVFGNIPANEFGWFGDAQGNIEACMYGDSINMIDYTDENLDDILEGNLSDISQVIEVSLEEVLGHIASNPMNDGSETVETLKLYFNKVG
jgi:hypothetical protein